MADAEHPHPVPEHPIHFSHAVSALLIVDGQLHNFEGQFRGSENQLIVAPQVSNAPTAESLLDPQPVLPPQYFGAAQGVFETLVQEIRENHPEDTVADLIKKLHGRLRHRVDETATVDEFPGVSHQRLEE